MKLALPLVRHSLRACNARAPECFMHSATNGNGRTYSVASTKLP